MKKQLLWACLLLSLTFMQKSEAAPQEHDPLTNQGDLTSNVGAIKVRLGGGVGTLIADLNTLSGKLGLLQADQGAGLTAQADTLLVAINASLVSKDAVGGHASFATIAADLDTITTDGISRATASTELGGDVDVTTVVGTANADFTGALDTIRATIVTTLGTNLATDVGTVAALLGTGASLQANITTINADLGSAGTMEERVAALQASLGGTGTMEARIVALQAQVAG